MKRIPIACWAAILLTVLTAQTSRADSIRFAESRVESLQRHSDDGEVFHEEVTRVAGTLTARLTFAGLATAEFDPSETFELTIGSLSFSSTLGDADDGDDNHAVWFLTNEEGRSIGRITIRRSGNVALLSASLKGGAESAVAGDHEGEGEPGEPARIAGETSFRMALGEFSTNRTLYYRGTASLRRQQVGTVRCRGVFPFDRQAGGRG